MGRGSRTTEELRDERAEQLPAAGREPHDPALAALMAVQRSAGNAAATALLSRAAASARMVQREGEDEETEEETGEGTAVAAPAKYVPPVRRGIPPVAQGPGRGPAALAPGWLDDAQLKNLGFWKAQGRWQKDLRPWRDFEIHISVNPRDRAFDEFHVKFDLPRTSHRVYYFYDVDGRPKWDKSTKPGAAKAALRAAGCPADRLEPALEDMDAIAKDEASALASRLR